MDEGQGLLRAACTVSSPGLHGRSVPLSFRSYLRARRYDFGRGSAEAWTFVAFAKGDPNFPDAGSWREIHDYLTQAGRLELVVGARSAWQSFTAFRSRALRAADPKTAGAARP